MNDHDDIAVISRILEDVSLDVHRVPEESSKRCDLRAYDRNEHYLLEIKGFHDDEDIKRAFRQGYDYEASRSLCRSLTIESAVAEAVVQLKQTPTGRHAPLRIVCLLARTRYGQDLTVEQINGTLYGTRYIVYAGPSGKAESCLCLYFSHSAFFRHRHELDAAIVIDSRGAGLQVNDHSANVERLKKSALGWFFAKRNALNDAISLEHEGGFLIADCGIDRKDEAAVLRYIALKYGLKNARCMEPEEHSVTAWVPNTRRKPRR